MEIYQSQKQLTAALQVLTQKDNKLAAAFAEYGTPDLRKMPDGFAGLARLLISQQVSTAAAAAIQARFEAVIGEVTPIAYLALEEDAVAACGISAPKRKYLRGVAEAAVNDGLDFADLRKADSETVYNTLTALKGIGPWTAQCYLLFSLRRADMFPAGDLALQEAVKMLYRQKTRPSAEKLTEFAERWRPHRGAAARLLWLYYNGQLAKAKAKKKAR